jgi:hypothetical protein
MLGFAGYRIAQIVSRSALIAASHLPVMSAVS